MSDTHCTPYILPPIPQNKEPLYECRNDSICTSIRNTDTLSSLEIMQMVEKLWPILPTVVPAHLERRA